MGKMDISATLILPTTCIQKFVLKQKLTYMFIFTLLCGASKGFMTAFKAFIKPFEAPQRSEKIKIYVNFLYSSGIETRRVNKTTTL